ncbi:MAG: hypothetical protein J0H17_19555 [Rhizobiales bacterium]|nr:hypothetical protein [Hyphomicrobiales bacterium]
MSNCISRAVLCLVVAFATAFGSLLPHTARSPSLDPIALAVAEAERHVQLETKIAEHVHSQDDGEDHERAAGHTHGHNPADHSHETPATALDGARVVPAFVRTWVPKPTHAAHLGTIFRLERPPKPIVIA